MIVTVEAARERGISTWAADTTIDSETALMRQAEIADVARGCCGLHDYWLGAETVRRNAQFEPALVGQHDGELSACIRELGSQQSAAGRDYPCIGDRPVVGIDDRGR